MGQNGGKHEKIINTKITLSVRLSRFHATTNELNWMKFGTQIVQSLRKDVLLLGYFLMRKKSCKGLKRGMDECIVIIKADKVIFKTVDKIKIKIDIVLLAL